MLLGCPAKFRDLFYGLSSIRCLYLSAAAMKNNLPDRWTEYLALGRRISGTRFIAFKVPLKKMYDNKLSPEKRFSPTDLILAVEEQNEQLGLVVDLTCTNRYYSPQELPGTLQYFKIFTAGHQVPTDDVIHKFKSVVKRFIIENAENDKLIGVHCTHGLNRTGYLVCRYMIDVLGMVPSDAIDRFNKSRGHCIERKNYLDDLLHGKTRKNLGPEKTESPQTRYQEPVPKVNVHSALGFRLPLFSMELPWISGRPCVNSNLGPQFAAPPFSHPAERYTPEPRYDYPQTAGRSPGPPFYNPWPTPRMPPQAFPHPPMSGHWHQVPQMDADLPHHFRSGPRHQHFQRHIPQHQDDWPVNDTLHIPKQNEGDMVASNEAQGFYSQKHGHKAPYRRHQGQRYGRNSRQ